MTDQKQELYAIQDEYELHGRLSRSSTARLRELLHGDEPYTAITVAVDCGLFELAPDIAVHLNARDDMVRWNAAAGLFTRFRLPEYAEKALEMAKTDKDYVVRNACVCGIGELLPRVEERSFRRDAAHYLRALLDDPELRTSAYEGILAAVDVLPLDRPPAGKELAPEDMDKEKIRQFEADYLQ